MSHSIMLLTSATFSSADHIWRMGQSAQPKNSPGTLPYHWTPGQSVLSVSSLAACLLPVHWGGGTWRRLGVPVSSWSVAEWGTVAASWGMELMSGSGVLLGGEMASGVINILGFSCGDRQENRGQTAIMALTVLNQAIKDSRCFTFHIG